VTAPPAVPRSAGLAGAGAAFQAGDRALAAWGGAFDKVAETVQRKILGAFSSAAVGLDQLGETTGYGYGDSGREAVEKIFAQAFDAESSLVRPHLATGTHALAVALFALLRPGDVVLSATGDVYDTLRPVLGPGDGSLADFGIKSCSVDPWENGRQDPDFKLVALAVEEHGPRVVLVQRSRGYTPRPALRGPELRALCALVKDVRPGTLVVVDNCYAEFVETLEPSASGADLACGSLIKNPGGGIVPAGGYIAGREELVGAAAARLYAPGLGGEVGPSLVPARLMLQGLFLAPAMVSTALKVATYAAAVFGTMGYLVSPVPGEPRADIVQAIRLGSRPRAEAFCRAVQSASPIDSRVVPEFSAMPGYGHKVIMAAGTFVQGASLELSADAPDREPYWIYLQGGLGLAYGKVAVEAAAEAVGPARGPAG
jgi:cystathionine beta-lyase family protein involved in aluminum resistance